MRERLSADVIVLGGGPAGSTLAVRLAQLGLDVVLVERARFPRPRLGESLTPGVLPLLALTGADVVVAEHCSRVDSLLVRWEADPRERHAEGPLGLMVDRSRFDLLLLEHARALGVRVLQPAVVSERRHDAERWHLEVEVEGRTVSIDAGFLAAASGRRGIPGRRIQTGPRTVSLYAYWTDVRPTQPVIEALDDGWCWCVPLPDGSVNVLVFVDPERLRRDESPERTYFGLLEASALASDLAGGGLAGPVRAADATPFLDHDSVTACAIKVGDAAVFVDPISSSGVQRAVQTALAGAVVVNTLLRRPSAADAAQRFYRDSLERGSVSHCVWAAGHYAAAASTRVGVFWARRAADHAVADPEPPPRQAPVDPDAPLAVSPDAVFVEVPCIAGSFVELRTAVAHPRLTEPVAYVGGWELAPLLRKVRDGLTRRELVHAWAGLLPESSAGAIAGWLTNTGVLVPAEVPA